MKRTSLSLPRFGQGIGLARTAWLAGQLGLDLPGLGKRAIVITGSNGKGSTASMLTALLGFAGERVGTFTSPHLFRFNERVRINGEPVDDPALLAAEARVAAAIERDRHDHPDDGFGEFEAWFLAALCLFEADGCERLVIEAGIGGRYDPTRLLQAPLAAIVSVDLEHTALLGATRREIALDKLDIAPPGGRVLVGCGLEAEWESLATVAALKRVGIEAADRAFGPVTSEDRLSGHSITLQHADMGQIRVETGLHGAKQADNLQLAIALASTARDDIAPARWPGLIAEALASARCEGRLEVLPGSPSLLIDVGHTPDAVEAAVTGAAELTRGVPAILLLGMSHNKDVDGMLSRLLPHFDRVILGQAYKGLPSDQLAARVRAVRPEIAILDACDDAAQALDAGRRQLPAEGVLVGLGGLFWAGALRACFTGQSLDALDFS